MSRIFCIVGKSGSGKDTIYRSILSEKDDGLIPVIPYTTRPKRADEEDGVNYFFVTQEQLKEYEKEKQIIEKRQYQTVQGVWNYFTRKFEIVDGKDYILITTLEGVRGIIDHYGCDMVHVIYLHLGDRERLLRCIQRESQQAKPDYSEVCRRYLADQEDFAEEKIRPFQNIHYIDTNLTLAERLDQWRKIYGSIDAV